MHSSALNFTPRGLYAGGRWVLPVAGKSLTSINPLRPHRWLTKQAIPPIVSRRVMDLPNPLHNYDAFAVGLNHIVSAAAAA